MCHICIEVKKRGKQKTSNKRGNGYYDDYFLQISKWNEQGSPWPL